jgi:hypothetical protein
MQKHVIGLAPDAKRMTVTDYAPDKPEGDDDADPELQH